MVLRPVNDVQIFKASTGNQELDNQLRSQLIHIALNIDEHPTPFLMSSIPQYIARTLYEQSRNLQFSYGYFGLLERKNPLKRVNKVSINVQSDNRSCHLSPANVLWCLCENFTAIDTSIWLDEEDEKAIDLYSGILLAILFDGDITLNGQYIHQISLTELYGSLVIQIQADKTYILAHPPEPVISFFSQYDFAAHHLSVPDNRLSIEAMIMRLVRMDTKPVLRTIVINDSNEASVYTASVQFEIGFRTITFQMIPSHALLLAKLLNQGSAFVEEYLLSK